MKKPFTMIWALLILSAALPAFGESCSSLFYTNIQSKADRQRHHVSPSAIHPETLQQARLSRSQLSYSPLNRLNHRALLPIERSLKYSEIIERKPFGGGINDTSLVTFSDGRRGVWKTHVEKLGSNYRAEVLAYELSHTLEFNLVPPTVERRLNGQMGSVQLFRASNPAKMARSRDLTKQYIFDFIIGNVDRHGGNWLKSPRGKVISIDNGLAFYPGYEAKSDMHLNAQIRLWQKTRSARRMIERLRAALADNSFWPQIKEYLGKEETLELIKRIEYVVDQAAKQS